MSHHDSISSKQIFLGILVFVYKLLLMSMPLSRSLSRSHVKCLRFGFEIISIGDRIGWRKGRRAIKNHDKRRKRGRWKPAGITIRTFFRFFCETEKRPERPKSTDQKSESIERKSSRSVIWFVSDKWETSLGLTSQFGPKVERREKIFLLRPGLSTRAAMKLHIRLSVKSSLSAGREEEIWTAYAALQKT